MRSLLKLKFEGRISPLLIVFSLAGVALALASGLIQLVVHHLTLAASIIIISIGIARFFELNIPFIGTAPSVTQRFRASGFFTYGIAYAFAGAGCTFPIFFAVVVYASIVPGIGSLVTMMTYSAGVAIPLLVTGALTVKANGAMVRRVGRATAKIQKISSLVLLAAGLYLLYYYFFGVA